MAVLILLATIVAALAMLQAAENGLQAALMAPTEILAEQHHLKQLATGRFVHVVHEKAVILVVALPRR